MHPLFKTGLAVVAVSAVVIVWLAYDSAANEQAWTHLAKARAQDMSIESLEAARADAAGSSAEPWIAYHLAMQLWDGGEPEQLAKAREVATNSIAVFPDHATTPYLEELVKALDTYTN